MALPCFPLFTFSRIITRDLLVRVGCPGNPSMHLAEAIAWLERAQDATPDGGVSYGYSLRGGWRPSYVETTGYIAVTFFDLAARARNQQPCAARGARERALRMVTWLTEVQLADGSFTNDRFQPGSGIVFDTGQDLLGLERAFLETDDVRFAYAADRACMWLCERAADDEGRWTRHTCNFNGIPQVYNSCVAWALAQSWKRTGKAWWERVARANLDWACREQNDHGWFEKCAFTRDAAPFTHTIAYAIRGLWEGGEILDDDRYRNAAVRAADAVIPHISPRGFLPGQIDVAGNAAARYCCLTGNCQLSIIYSLLHRATGEVRYEQAARSTLEYVMSCQDLEHKNPGVRGAIKGSQPIWGRYSPVTYPNWATKFYIDALLLCEEWPA
jgi:hypothetical protein